MHFKLFDKVADRFHGDVKVQQGVPTCIAALDDIIAIGSSDGSVRLFDSKDEAETKIVVAKDMKGVAVTCLDLKRIRGNQSLFLVAGHVKGQISLFEIKNLAKFPATSQNASIITSVTFRHLKTISDIHVGQLVQVKFFGEFKRETRYINVVSCDIAGTCYLSRFCDNVLGYTCNKQCFYKARLKGPAFAISPLFYDFDGKFDN